MFRLVLFEELDRLDIECEDIKRDFKNKFLSLEEANIFLEDVYERESWVIDAYTCMLTYESPKISLDELNFCMRRGIVSRESWLN